MRLFRIAGIYILLALVAVSVWPSLGKAKDAEGLFAFVYHIPQKHNNLEEFGLYGEHRINQKVSLFHISDNTVCAAITLRNEMSSSEVAPFPFTVLRTTSKCDKPAHYRVGFFGNISDYRTVPLKTVDQRKIIDSLDKASRGGSIDLSVYGTTWWLTPFSENLPLEVFVPRVHRFDLSSGTGYLVSYERKDPYAYGPRFIVINGKPQRLTGWCSYPDVHSFMLNGELYFESGSTCCNCGISIMGLYKVKAGQVSLVHGDTSNSD